MRLRRSSDRLRLDDEAALRAVYDEHAGELFAFALCSLGDAGLAEEVVQETFLRAWRSAAGFDSGVASARTWLFAICRNAVIDRSRARSVRPQFAPGEGGLDVPDGATMERLLVGMQVEEALRRLSPDHRRVLVEVHVLDRSPMEVAVELRIPVGTVRNRVYFALKALRLLLEEMGWEA